MEKANAVILIPAFNPDEKLLQLLAELKDYFSRIVLVNDGSTEGLDIFERASTFVEKIIVHEKNRGKGAALRTGFSYIKNADTITVDADGQHTLKDILKIAEALKTQRNGLVLGVRAFSGPVPFRSRFGNFWTRWFFFFMIGLMIRDTQTGLRGIPREMLPRVLSIPGNRYEYEMAMLVDARCHDSKPLQIPIETIYLANNETSHFNPVKDTIRIYRSLFQFCLSSVLCFVLDNAIFALCAWFLATKDSSPRKIIFISLFLARLVSANVNYFYNKIVVFRLRGRKRSFLQYWGLVIAIATASYILTRVFSAIFDVSGVAMTIVKIFAEIILFFASYFIQKKLIFKRKV